MPGVVDEIKAGGPKGIFGVDQIDWGNNAIYEFWKVAPCCGPPDPKDALCCMFHWWCCGPCAASKLYSSSSGVACSLIPHCLLMVFLPFCGCTFARYNLRKKSGTPGNIIGDCLCTWCCGPCSACQMLRSTGIDSWYLLPLKVEVVSPQGACEVIK